MNLDCLIKGFSDQFLTKNKITFVYGILFACVYVCMCAHVAARDCHLDVFLNHFFALYFATLSLGEPGAYSFS